mmetsp:Transcript_85900/g.277404  ORF Transcript_85900/g.277404 Transcript_85900/m.277404 type:complete len:209 (+) Transcript_85900:635-1261(+)
MSMPGTKKRLLESEAMIRTSKARASMAPAAVKCPLRAATVGTLNVKILESNSSASVWILVDSETFAEMYCKSIPLQKNLPSPATTTACAPSRSAASSAEWTCSINRGLILCSNTRVPQGNWPSGPSMVTTATPSTISVFSSCVGAPAERPRRPSTPPEEARTLAQPRARAAAWHRRPKHLCDRWCNMASRQLPAQRQSAEHRNCRWAV